MVISASTANKVGVHTSVTPQVCLLYIPYIKLNLLVALKLCATLAKIVMGLFYFPNHCIFRFCIILGWLHKHKVEIGCVSRRVNHHVSITTKQAAASRFRQR